ncbi:hypothetical protein SAMN05444678_11521 [Sphingomonas sp. YR710]|nr:hypothetical protein SAMN05444678_11521 [Sphingomonas sp. YR710]
MPDEEVLDRIERMLERERKPVTQRSLNGVVFHAPLWGDAFGPNWLAMVIYDHGDLWIEQGPRGRILEYDLRSLHGFIFCLFAAAIFFVFGLANGGAVGATKYAAFAFVWLYGMNMFLAWGRIPRLIRRAVEGA